MIKTHLLVYYYTWLIFMKSNEMDKLFWLAQCLFLDFYWLDQRTQRDVEEEEDSNKKKEERAEKKSEGDKKTLQS